MPPVDPGLQPLLDAIATSEGPGLDDLPVEVVRATYRLLFAADGPPQPVAETRDIDAGGVPARLYRPEDSTPGPALPVVVWFHSGGMVIGDLETADTTARRLANRAGAMVVSVDYRLAPEHPCPASIEDAWTATRWVASNVAELGGDPARLAVGGDSAGGGLAALVAIRARDQGGPRVVHQLLVYPWADATLTMPSVDENGEGKLLTKAQMLWFAHHFRHGGAIEIRPEHHPLGHDDLTGLPPATVLTAEHDPLRDEGNEYAARLARAGVDVEHVCYEGMTHLFFALSSLTKVADEALDLAAARLRRSFGTGTPQSP